MATVDDSVAVSGDETRFGGSGLQPGVNGDNGLKESGGGSVETGVEANHEVELASNGGKGALVDEVGTGVESLLVREAELESGSVFQETDEIVLDGDKGAPVNEAGAELVGEGNNSATLTVCNQVREGGTVVGSSLGCEAELQSGSGDQQMNDVSTLDSVAGVGAEKNGNGCSADKGSEASLSSGLVNQPANVVSIMNSVSSEVGLEKNGNGYSIDPVAEDGEVSHLDDGDAMDITVSQLNDSKGSPEGTVDAEGKQQDHGFRVGDFVWGKIKTHPWWPGQIYDTKDASDVALRCSHEGRILVAFFGDGSYSWCLPSQLEPFIDNFDNMSKGSHSRSFLNAIEEALDEISRVVELGLVCQCIPEEKRGDLARTLAGNAGIKEGVLKPEVETCRVSVPKFEPNELLSKLRQFAVGCHGDDALELTMMRSWLSAFYRLKCGSQLPIYLDPLLIEGMEDQTANADDSSVLVDAPVVGPTDDWLSSPTKAQPDEKNSHKRKHKSIAELIGKNKNPKPRSRKKSTGKEGTDLLIETSLLKGKKSDDSSSGKISRKRRNSVSESSEIPNNTVLTVETSNLGGANGTSQGPLPEKPEEIELTPAAGTPREEKEALETLSTPRERKKSKYLSPPYTNPTWRMGNASFKAYAEILSEYRKSKKVNKTHAIEENEHLEKVDASNVKMPEADKDHKTLSFSVSDVDVPADTLLSKIQYAAVDPVYLTKDGSFDMVFAFCSAMRRSTYAHGSDYKVFGKKKGSVPRKRKLSSLQCEIPGNAQKSPESVEVEELAKTKKKKAKTSDLKSNAGGEEADQKFAPSLIMVFKPEATLPSKEDIVNYYSKFGSLFEHDTCVMPDSQLVQIVFRKEAEANKAFEVSMQENSFGFENLLCDMLQTSPRSRSGGPSLEPSDDLASDARAMANKFMLMSDNFEKYHSKFSEDDKLMLKEEMKRLKEKAENVYKTVETVCEVRGTEHEASS